MSRREKLGGVEIERLRCKCGVEVLITRLEWLAFKFSVGVRCEGCVDHDRRMMAREEQKS